MVQNPIQDRSGNDPIAEHLAPGTKALIAGQDHRSLLVATTDELEEEIGTDPVDGQIADLVNDEQARHGKELCPSGERA